MLSRAVPFALACCAAFSLHTDLGAQSSSVPTEVRFPVRDSLDLVADLHPGHAGPSGPTILLFHQGGGSARGEYRAIIPRLLGEGYNVLAADVRGGGDRFGMPSRAAATGPGFRYCDALAEVDAAVSLARVRGLTGPLVLWGSSYTASLVLQVAARRSADVRAVLAFSPASGEPMEGCEPAAYVGWLARAGVPTLVLRPRVELEDSSRAAALEAMRNDGATVFVAERGVHGSSMLDAERTKTGTEPQWAAVLGFLRRALVPLRPLEGERVVSIPSDSGLVLRGDLLLPARTPAPLVVLLHKAAGDRAIYRDLASRLVAAGIGSLRVDLRGHGESLGRGRFVPGQPAAVIAGTDRDIAAVWRFVRGLPGVDTSRLATVSGSYSSRSAMVAARTIGYGRAHAALSPGDFTDEAFRAAAASGASWLFVRSDSERFVGDWLDAKVRAFVPGAELWVVPAGSAHATDLLAADPAFPGRLTAWLARQLSAPGGSGPGPRNAHGAAYDIRDRSLVLFGGATEREVGGDTWRWNGSWRRIAESGPEPRTFPAMAFDSARGEVVLFGGNRVLFGDGTTPPRMLGDTWVLRGDRWVRVSTGGPSPRAEAAVAYDAGRGRTVLFGGRDLRPGGGTNRLGDTWEWDGRRWYRVSTSGPSARSGAAMAYDPGLRAVVLFGGSGGPLGDSWIWDGLRWRKLPVPDAPGRFNTVMAWDPGARTLVRFGGWDGGGRAADTWVREPAGWVVVDSAGPAARNHAVLVSAPDRGALLLYGGHDGERVFGDLWEWRGGGWVAIDSAEPVARVANGH